MLSQVQTEHPAKIIELWFQDEARIGQQGRLTRIWGEKGKRQRIPKDMGFKYSYIYGAICPERDIGEALVIDVVCKKAMQNHLNAISLRIPEDRHGVILMDRAPWHRSLKIPDNMAVIYLPPYSPELNSQENVWEYLKNNFLSNKVFLDLNHVIDTCCDAWNQLCAEVGRIKSIGIRDWATIN
jgi:putative transposase